MSILCTDLKGGERFNFKEKRLVLINWLFKSHLISSKWILLGKRLNFFLFGNLQPCPNRQETFDWIHGWGCIHKKSCLENRKQASFQSGTKGKTGHCFLGDWWLWKKIISFILGVAKGISFSEKIFKLDFSVFKLEKFFTFAESFGFSCYWFFSRKSFMIFQNFDKHPSTRFQHWWMISFDMTNKNLLLI